ncbi:hypothetical protein L484_002190 [Morus notabilis]|uniref:Transcription repressor n=1 Tax=Morus notabilis TaxID=981085 RepID=W9RIL6_9ROSA|nr:transcription repressor OFP8 [Morus notabilis]EXB79936.1 hypothetical protein L484_002190 [Morus notabilis]
MAENRFKHKLSRMFRGSFGSCRSRHLSDVIKKTILSPEITDDNLHSFHMTEPINQNNGHNNNPPLPKPRPFPSICRPKWSEPVTEVDLNNCIKSTIDVMLPRPKLSERLYPVFPLNPFYEQRKKKKKKENGKRNQYKKSTKKTTFSSSSVDSNLGGGGVSSRDEENDEREADETSETLFSSKSLCSSDSSEARRRRRYRRRRASSEMGLVPLEGRVKDSFAVVKKSSDPHNDFRTSMVEMIVEKQIFSAKDLEQLLQCFLSLNSEHHHRVIVEVFTEILEALFSNWGS